LSLFDRTLLSHPRFHTKNLNKTIKVLTNNGYPLDFIFYTVNNHIKHFSFTEFEEPLKENSENNKDNGFLYNSIHNEFFR